MTLIADVLMIWNDLKYKPTIQTSLPVAYVRTTGLLCWPRFYNLGVCESNTGVRYP